MDDPAPPKLRRTWLSGYRIGDVDVLLAQFRLRVRGTAARAPQPQGQLLARRSPSATGRGAGERARRRARGGSGRVAHALEQTLEDARLDAARIRAAAALEEERARSQVEELLRLRDTLATTLRTVSRATSNARCRASRSPSRTRASARARAGCGARAGGVVAAPAVEPPAPAGDLFNGQVEVEAGPFQNFASLAAFEQALGGLSKVEDVYIRRFEGDRATIEITLQEPAALLDEMTQRLPYRLTVDVAEHDRIELEVADG